MLRKCKAEITVRKLDNGFVIEWEQQENPIPDADGGIWEPSGIEIFTDRKTLLKRIEQLI